ncbi:MAG: hypothetical protein VCD00_19340 [Candidatus Hydrogenedentota bacterium]
MIEFALVLTCLFAGTIVFFAVRAEFFFEMVDSLTLRRLLVAGAIRIVFGVVLIGAAAASGMPTFLKILGVLFILGGISTPIIGVDNIRAMAAIYQRNAWIFRMVCVVPLLLFGFVAYALGR